jgi:putative nucleotidyltransferase with HDIG domain
MREEYNEIIKNITGALKGMNYYSPMHPAVLQQIERSMQFLRPLLFEKNEVLVGIVDSVLVFEGEPFYKSNQSVDEFVERLTKRNIQGIQFKHGLTQEELSLFLQLLNEDPEVLNQKGGIEEVMIKKGIVNILPRKLEEKEEEDIQARAKKVYSDARNAVLEIMKDARIGKVPSATKVVRIVSDMTDIMLKDRSLLLGLAMIQDHDEYTFNHSVNVGILSLTLANALNYTGKDLIDIGLGGLLHDIGKTETPKEIILKPTKLTPEEWEIMKLHPVKGYAIVSKMEGISKLTARIVYEHHLQFNRSGYPAVPENYEPTPLANIVTISDCYDSMTTLRPYQKRFDPKEALLILSRKVNEAFNPEYFRTFVRILGIYPIGSIVRLDTNEIAIVTKINLDEPDRPIVKILFNSDGIPLKTPVEVALNERDAHGRVKRNVISSVDPSTQALVDLNRIFK